jgi:hypothetical protein
MLSRKYPSANCLKPQRFESGCGKSIAGMIRLVFMFFTQLFLAFKSRLQDLVRQFLARQRIVLFRVPSDVAMPPTLIQYVKNLSNRKIVVDTVFGFDDEAQIQKEILSIFPADRVLFTSRSSGKSEKSGFQDINSIRSPTSRNLIEIDIESVDIDGLADDIPWLFEANVILLRSTLGYFWSGKGDLRNIVNLLDNHGFNFTDTLEYFKLHLLNAPLGRIVFAFENRRLKSTAQSKDETDYRTAIETERLKRVGDSLVFLSNPIARSSELVRLGGRGSFGYAAGIVNPGAITDGGNITLLGRGEKIPWGVSRHNLSDFLNGCRPVLFELNDKLSISDVAEAKFIKAENFADTRMEDFRLFRYQSHLFCSHSWVVISNDSSTEAKTFRHESLQTKMGISHVDLNAKEIRFFGTPAVDFSTGPSEKNWVFFQRHDELFLIYSFNPFHLLRASEWPQMNFITVTRKNLATYCGDDQLKFRNSVNPVEYDQDYFLHVIHKVYPGKQYAFWAVLIEKNSLLPKKISARPLVCGWKSAPAAIIYVCSVIARNEDILIFGGIDDSSMGFWKVARTKLDETWIPLNHVD